MIFEPGGLDAVPGGAERPAGAATDLAALTAGWLHRWPGAPPVGELLVEAYPALALRLRTDDGQRRPDPEGFDPEGFDPDRAAGLLLRLNTVLDRLFGGREVYVVSGDYAEVSVPAAPAPPLAGLNPDAVHWLRLLSRDAYAYHDRALDLYAIRRPWRAGGLDRLLLAACTGLATNVLLMATALHRVVHPHAGGVDILVTGPAERDELHLDYPGWFVTPAAPTRHRGGPATTAPAAGSGGRDLA